MFEDFFVELEIFGDLAGDEVEEFLVEVDLEFFDGEIRFGVDDRQGEFARPWGGGSGGGGRSRCGVRGGGVVGVPGDGVVGVMGGVGGISGVAGGGKISQRGSGTSNKEGGEGRASHVSLHRKDDCKQGWRQKERTIHRLPQITQISEREIIGRECTDEG